MARSVEFPRPVSRMSGRDAGFLYLERPGATLHIGCVAIVEGELEPDHLERILVRKLPRLPRYRQRAVGVPLAAGHPSWEEDPEFDPRHHIVRWSLPAPGGEAELCETVANLMEQPLERGRPLWEMHLLQGLHGGRTALLQKVHHCMVDGMAGAQLLEELLEVGPRAAHLPVPMPPPERPLPGSTRRWARAVGEGVRAGLGGALGMVVGATRPQAARRAVERLQDAAFAAVGLISRDVPEMPWNAPIGPRRRIAFTRVPMDGVRRVRHAVGGTVNDVVLSVVAGGLHRYCRHLGLDTRALELTAMVPVSLRDARAARSMGNRISAMLVPLCVDVPEEAPRLRATRAITEQLKERSQWVGIDALLSVVDGLPPWLVKTVGEHVRVSGIANLIVTNVPGPRETRYLGPARVEALLPLVPLAGTLGLGIAIFSYDGELAIGLNADADLVPDLEKLRQAIEQAFTALVGGLSSG